ncbi:hypothetical protein FVE85_9462 [Porphyridium purpureum]|uniref:Uncharacterized protein n=1 Tax=Porphyridium purpureum TaxID=35688 RepID=A0A5J4YL42_PORPP|nr:hypothetical protein FVE85_9462 [Porphyridium purpureum]|eukprot:POR0531..scf261_15
MPCDGDWAVRIGKPSRLVFHWTEQNNRPGFARRSLGRSRRTNKSASKVSSPSGSNARVKRDQNIRKMRCVPTWNERLLLVRTSVARRRHFGHRVHQSWHGVLEDFATHRCTYMMRKHETIAKLRIILPMRSIIARLLLVHVLGQIALLCVKTFLVVKDIQLQHPRKQSKVPA